MNAERYFYTTCLSIFTLIFLAAFSAQAEIVILDGDKGVSVESSYIYVHPRLRSVVFVSQQYRDMAILPPAPYFIASPPLLMSAPMPFITYPITVYQSSINYPGRPSNRDNTTYNLERAHRFSMDEYREY